MGLRAKGALADKPDDLAGRKRAQAVDRDEVRVMLFCQRLDLACEGGDAPGYKSLKVLADDAEINQFTGTLIEYDSVINQILMYLFDWGLKPSVWRWMTRRSSGVTSGASSQ